MIVNTHRTNIHKDFSIYLTCDRRMILGAKYDNVTELASVVERAQVGFVKWGRQAVCQVKWLLQIG
jgi:hypothetical protein